MGNAVIRARPGEVDQQVALLDRILERRKIRKEVRDLRKVGIDVTAADLREERFSQAFGKPTGADPFTGRPTYRVPTVSGRKIDPETGMFFAKRREVKPPRFKSSPAMRRGMMGQQLGFSRILDRGMLRVGGRKLAKSAFGKGAKSIIRSSVSGIPLIGDLIALLLDVFVFGEPVGRAAFMAVGSIIGGIIGGVAGLVAGPVGALIGGLVGSVGGDLLGAAFYDLIFRRGGVDVGSRFGNAITRGGIKAGVSGALEAGGFANYGKYLLGEAGTEFVLDADSTAAIEDKYPGFLMALNKSDGAGAIYLIREYASYETEGRVDFIPIPIPSVTNSDPQVIVINSQPKDKRLYSQHYRRG